MRVEDNSNANRAARKAPMSKTFSDFKKSPLQQKLRRANLDEPVIAITKRQSSREVISEEERESMEKVYSMIESREWYNEIKTTPT